MRFERDIPGTDRRALEALVSAGVLTKGREGRTVVFAPVVSLAAFRAPKKRKRSKAQPYQWAVVHFADGVQVLVGSYFGECEQNAIRQRCMALGSFRELAPSSAVPAVSAIEPLSDVSEELRETCFEQKYVNPAWGKSLATVTDRERMHYV